MHRVVQASGQSLMPEGLENDLTEQGLADVIAYLIQTKTVNPSDPKP